MMIAETYVNQIVKKVKCSKQKRNEIRRQILADVNAAMEQGEPLEVVMLRMGEPIAIAEEFNDNLSEKERRKYKWSIAAKTAAGILIAAATLICLALWFLPRGAEMGSSGIYDGAQVEAQAKEIIRLLDGEEYEKLLACSVPQMKKILTKEVIDAAKEQVGIDSDWGRFRKFGKCYMQELKQRGKTLAVAQINAAYENAGVTYTVLFDQNMQLSGIYIK